MAAPITEQTRIVCELIKVLQDVATTFECAIMLTNDTEVDASLLKTALDDIFQRLIPQRIFMSKSNDGDIVANVQKKLCGDPSLVKLSIKAEGVRDG